ncbi:MAG: alpha/beta hydrolase [Fimbriimonadaceae bacterium]
MIAAAAFFLSLVQGPLPELDVTYSKVAGEELKMDIYRPPSGPVAVGIAGQPAGTNAKLPVVLVIHGGAWISGTRKDMTQMAQELAKRGVVAATISYRLAPKHKWPAMLDDVQTAVRFLRANAAKYGIDPKKVGAAGASAGGHLSVFLGVTDTRDKNPVEYPGFSSKVKAVFDIFGPTDLTNRVDFPPNAMMNMLSLQVFGKKFEDAGEIARSASPLFLVTSDDAPTFILQGLADPLVNPNQSRVLEKKLKEVGVRCDSAYVEGMPHGLPLEQDKVKAAVEKAVKWFLDELRK